jgi:hypothetical protein
MTIKITTEITLARVKRHYLLLLRMIDQNGGNMADWRQLKADDWTNLHPRLFQAEAVVGVDNRSRTMLV